MLESLDDADPDDVLARLADPARDVSRAQLRGLDDWLSGRSVTRAGPRFARSRRRRVVVVDASDAVIVDAPDLFALLGNYAIVPVVGSRAAELADRLDLPLASELADYSVVSQGSAHDDAVVHDRLRVADVDGAEREVGWRLVDGTLHVDSRRARGRPRTRASLARRRSGRSGIG